MDIGRTPSSTSFQDAALFGDDFHNLWIQGMCRALEIQKTSLAAFVSLNACAIEIYKHTFWFAPSFDDLVKATALAFACCTEMQTMLTPFDLSYGATTSRAAADAEPPKAEELAYSMDVAIGAESTGTPGSKTKAPHRHTENQNTAWAA